MGALKSPPLHFCVGTEATAAASKLWPRAFAETWHRRFFEVTDGNGPNGAQGCHAEALCRLVFSANGISGTFLDESGLFRQVNIRALSGKIQTSAAWLGMASGPAAPCAGETLRSGR